MKWLSVPLLLFAASALADLSKLDIDGDGRVSKAEAAGNADMMMIFDRADRDRDGRLTQAEVDAYEKRMKSRASASSGGTKGKAPPREKMKIK